MEHIRELLKAATVLDEVAKSPTADIGTIQVCGSASRILRKIFRELNERPTAATYGLRGPAVTRVLKSQQ